MKSILLLMLCSFLFLVADITAQDDSCIITDQNYSTLTTDDNLTLSSEPPAPSVDVRWFETDGETTLVFPQAEQIVNMPINNFRTYETYPAPETDSLRPNQIGSSVAAFDSHPTQPLIAVVGNGIWIQNITNGLITPLKVNDRMETAYTAVAISHDGLLLAAANETVIEIYDILEGEIIQTLILEGNRPKDLQFSPDGSQLITLYNAIEMATIWDTDTWESVFTIPRARTADAMAISPDSRYLVIVGFTQNRLQIFDLTTLEEVPAPTHDEHIRDVVFHPMESLVMFVDDNELYVTPLAVLLEEGADNTPLSDIEDARFVRIPLESQFDLLSMSPDARYLMLALQYQYAVFYQTC